MTFLAALATRLDGFVWQSDLAAAGQARTWLVGALRLCFAVGRDFLDGQLSLRAMGLVYTTLLSLVPALALSFSVLKGFGVHNQIEPILLEMFEPLGEKAPEVVQRIIEFVNNMNAGVLGSLGLALLFYTVVSLMQKIEQALNFTWRVQKERSIAQRVSHYITVIIVGPVLVFASLGITASVMGSKEATSLAAIRPLGYLFDVASALTPYLLVVIAFAFIYLLMPNTRVKPAAAFFGAAIGAGLWKTVGWGFASFLVSSGKYTAIYSAFATLVFFMIWLYVAWLVLILGSAIAFYYQNPAYRAVPLGGLRLSSRERERLGLEIVRLLGSAFYRNRGGVTPEILSHDLNLPGDSITWALAALERRGLVVRTLAQPPAYMPGLPYDQVTIREVVETMRIADEERGGVLARTTPHGAVAKVLDELDHAAAQAVAGRSVLELIEKAPAPPAP